MFAQKEVNPRLVLDSEVNYSSIRTDFVYHCSYKKYFFGFFPACRAI